MKFEPKTEEQIHEENLLPEGEYDFQCVEAIDTVSKKSGKEMIKAELQVFDGARCVYVTDYLMASMAHKLLRFCDIGGLRDKYDAGELTAQDCIGVCGRVILKKESQEGFKPKNAVKNYAKVDANTESKAASRPSAASRDHYETVGPDDDIPW